MRRITGNPPKEAPQHIKINKRNAPKLPERSFKNLKRWIKFGFPKLIEPGSLMAKSGWVAQRGGDAGGARQQFASWTRLTSDESEADKGAERTRVTENSFDTRRKWKQKPALHFLCYILLTSLDQVTKNRLKRQPFSPFSPWMPSPPFNVWKVHTLMWFMRLVFVIRSPWYLHSVSWLYQLSVYHIYISRSRCAHTPTITGNFSPIILVLSRITGDSAGEIRTGGPQSI